MITAVDSCPGARQPRVSFGELHLEDAIAAGQAWREYRRRGGSRARVTADFLVGAHARARADRLLTRDRSFFRSYFRGLQVMDPSAG